MSAETLRRATAKCRLTAVVVLVIVTRPALCRAAPFAYITNSRSDSVWVVDTATNTVAAVVRVGHSPVGVAVDPSGTRVYVVNQEGTISVLDAATNSVSATVVLPTPGATPPPESMGSVLPLALAVSPNGAHLYVPLASAGVVIDTATNQIIGTFPLPHVRGPGGLAGVAISPDGTRLYVVDDKGGLLQGKVVVIDTMTHSMLSSVLVGTGPIGIAVNPAGSEVYVVDQQAYRPSLSVIDTVEGRVAASVPLASGEDDFARARAVAVHPGGAEAYVTVGAGFGIGRLAIIDLANRVVTDTIPVGEGPSGVALTPDGARAYVANTDDATISVVDVVTRSVSATVGVGLDPMALGQFIGPEAPADVTPTATPTAAPEREFAYVTAGCAEKAFVINTASHAVSGAIPAGAFDLAITADGALGYFAGCAPGLCIVDAAERRVAATVAFGPCDEVVGVTPDGSTAYVGNLCGDTLSVVDAANMAILGVVIVGRSPRAIAIRPDGAAAYVANSDSGSVSVIDTASNTVRATVTGLAVGLPRALALSGDGAGLYVTGAGVAVVDTKTDAVIRTFPVGSPFIAVSEDGRRAFVNGEQMDTVAVLDTETGDVLDSIQVGLSPARAALADDGAFLYVVDASGNTISVVDTSTDGVVATVPLGGFLSRKCSGPVALAIAPAPSGTRLPVFTPRSTWTPLATPTPTSTASPSRTPTALRCSGDCDGDGRVTNADVVTELEIVLGSLPPEACPALQPRLDGVVTVEDLLTAARQAIFHCGASGTPHTAKPTATTTPSPPGPPNLTASVFIAPAPARGCASDAGEVPRLQVRVRNEGIGPAGPFSVSLGGEEVWRVDSLAPGATIDLYGPFFASGEVAVDSRREVAEADEGDNDISFSLPVPTPPVTCTPSRTATPSPLEFHASCCEGLGACRDVDFPFCTAFDEIAYPDPYICNPETGRCEVFPPTQAPTATPTPSPAGPPDLVAADVFIAPPPLRGCIIAFGEVPRLRVCVSNGGLGDGPAFSLGLNGEDFARLDGLRHGERRCVDGPFVPAGEIVVDSAQEVSEADETNNARSFSLPIPTPPVTCTPNASPTRTPTA